MHSEAILISYILPRTAYFWEKMWFLNREKSEIFLLVCSLIKTEDFKYCTTKILQLFNYLSEEIFKTRFQAISDFFLSPKDIEICWINAFVSIYMQRIYGKNNGKNYWNCANIIFQMMQKSFLALTNNEISSILKSFLNILMNCILKHLGWRTILAWLGFWLQPTRVTS